MSYSKVIRNKIWYWEETVPNSYEIKRDESGPIGQDKLFFYSKNRYPDGYLSYVSIGRDFDHLDISETALDRGKVGKSSGILIAQDTWDSFESWCLKTTKDTTPPFDEDNPYIPSGSKYSVNGYILDTGSTRPYAQLKELVWTIEGFLGSDINGDSLVRSSLDCRIKKSVKNLILTGSLDINGTGNASANNITGNNSANTLNGGKGNDTLNGGKGNDKLNGGNGNDALNGGLGNDLLVGGRGNDTAVFSAKNNHINLALTRRQNTRDGRDILRSIENVDGGAGNDTITGNNSANTLYGGNGNDKLNGGADNDRLFGDAGKDLLIGGAGNDRLYGRDDNDRLFGEAGNDILFGGKGADTFNGGEGSDQYIGGNGADRFCINKGVGRDVIADYGTGNDQIKLLGGIKERNLTINQAGSDVRIKYEDDLLAIVKDTVAADINFI